MLDAAHKKELIADETIQNLKNDVTNLTKIVQQGEGFSTGQEHR